MGRSWPTLRSRGRDLALANGEGPRGDQRRPRRELAGAGPWALGARGAGPLVRPRRSERLSAPPGLQQDPSDGLAQRLGSSGDQERAGSPTGSSPSLIPGSSPSTERCSTRYSTMARWRMGSKTGAGSWLRVNQVDVMRARSLAALEARRFAVGGIDGYLLVRIGERFCNYEVGPETLFKASAIPETGVAYFLMETAPGQASKILRATWAPPNERSARRGDAAVPVRMHRTADAPRVARGQSFVGDSLGHRSQRGPPHCPRAHLYRLGGLHGGRGPLRGVGCSAIGAEKISSRSTQGWLRCRTTSSSAA